MASRLALLALTVLLGTADAQQNCNQAPTAALRITCQQINNWDSNARTVRLTAKTLIASPGFSGLSVGSVPISGVASSSSPTVAYECMDIPCLCGFFGGTGSTTCTLANGQTLSKALRKEYRMLTDDERQKYNTAMWTIKSNGDYDTLSQIHSQYITSPGAHSGPAFPGWHREFIKRLEIALRRVDPTVALPYWDSTLDSTLPNPSQSCLWGNELMGSQDSTGTVRTGAFRNWLTVDGSRVFTRDIGKTGNLLNEADIQALLSTPDFTQLLAFTAPQAACPNPAGWSVLEYIHGGPHVFTGGDMLITTTATNDPLFFNHHSMIDLIWELWRTQQQSRTERETEYPDDNAACSSSAHFANNTMAPFFPMVNLDGLSNKYTDNLYQYSPRPTCSNSNVNGCGSKYLFCDVSHGLARCASKINLGGNCSGYTNNEDACYLGQCMNSICTAIPTPSPTTQPPIVTTTPVAPQQETCFNEQQCCSPWSSRGECSRNPTYMNVWCKASCGVCTPSTYDLTQECSNRHLRCISWAQSGECRRNPSWMMENCRQSCGGCTMTRSQACGGGATTSSTTTTTTTTTITTTTAPPTNTACLNQNYCCLAWSTRGYCAVASLQQYMNQYCQPACGACSGSPSGSTTLNTRACNDFHPNCASWKARGQCTANRVYMWENCRQSCGACNIGMLSARLSSCGFSRESVSVRRPVSAFRSQSAPLTSRVLMVSPVAPPTVPLSAPVLQQRNFAPLAANPKRLNRPRSRCGRARRASPTTK